MLSSWSWRGTCNPINNMRSLIYKLWVRLHRGYFWILVFGRYKHTHEQHHIRRETHTLTKSPRANWDPKPRTEHLAALGQELRQAEVAEEHAPVAVDQEVAHCDIPMHDLSAIWNGKWTKITWHPIKHTTQGSLLQRVSIGSNRVRCNTMSVHYIPVLHLESWCTFSERTQTHIREC